MKHIKRDILLGKHFIATNGNEISYFLGLIDQICNDMGIENRWPISFLRKCVNEMRENGKVYLSGHTVNVDIYPDIFYSRPAIKIKAPERDLKEDILWWIFADFM